MPITRSAPSRSEPAANPLAPAQAVLISAAIVVAWALWAAFFNSAQFGDNIEQFNWAQSLELGYHKHPPLPSWILGAAIRLFGSSIYWAYGLATLSLLGTLAFTWLIGRELLGARLAAAACVLWGLNMSFSLRAQLYNHNTVLVLCIAATVWFAMRASRGGAVWWLATGVAAGAAMLSKYQAAVPLAGLVLALVASGRMRGAAQWRGLGGAFVLMLLVCAPHAVWVVRHDFSTLRYASEAVESSGLPARLGFVASFFANQVRLEFPALLAVVVCWGLARRRRTAAAPAATRSDAEIAPDLPAWMLGLVWSGLLVLVAMALLGGVSLRNHWGVQTLQFLPLWLVWRWERAALLDLRRLVWVALCVQGLSLAFYAYEHSDPRAALSSRRNDTMYPAQRLAEAAQAHWAASTACSARYVAGTNFDAGLVALYAAHKMEVFESAVATPWVSRDDVERRGALYVLDTGDAVPQGVTNVVTFDLVPGTKPGPDARFIRLGVQMPVGPCP